MLEQDCIGVNYNGIHYEELACLYPNTIGKIVSPLEQFYDPIPMLSWMQHHNAIPVVAVMLYGLLIVWGQSVMRKREAWKWRKILALWNFSLSLFSFVGATRTVPHVFHNLATKSVRDNFCLDAQLNYGSGSTGLWVQLFILSKFPELLDTFFIVINKKPLIFLHWYHHITVLLYCWHSYVTTSPVGLFFCAMNYSVHAIMYFYYFLMAMRMKPKWFNAMYITSAQISQMIVGISVAVTSFYYYQKDDTCLIQRENNIAAFVMYGSYLFLFAQFFMMRFKPTKKAKSV